MNREIKFRAWDSESKTMNKCLMIWLGNNLGVQFINESGTEITLSTTVAKEEVYVMQFTGLKDKNGVEAYEGDILKYYVLKRYTQQSHADVRPEIDELYLKKETTSIVFKNGAFQSSKINDEDDWFLAPISTYGLYNIQEIKDSCGCVDDESSDINGNEINESVLGFEIIGNIYQNPELLN